MDMTDKFRAFAVERNRLEAMKLTRGFNFKSTDMQLESEARKVAGIAYADAVDPVNPRATLWDHIDTVLARLHQEYRNIDPDRYRYRRALVMMKDILALTNQHGKEVWSQKDLSNFGFTPLFINDVAAITKASDEDEMTHIERVAMTGTADAVVVKMCALEVALSPGRIRNEDQRKRDLISYSYLLAVQSGKINPVTTTIPDFLVRESTKKMSDRSLRALSSLKAA